MPESPSTPMMGITAADGIEDPFDAFNAASGQGSVRDPYPIFAAMRQAAPVHRVAMDENTQAESSMLRGVSREIYVAVSYDAVKEVLTDADRFCSAGYAESMGLVMGHSILEMDGAEHTRHRRLINRAFTRHALESWERDLVRPVVNRYVDGFAKRGRADLVRELAFPFPVQVIAAMMGLPEELHASFHRLAIEIIGMSIDFERGMEASKKLGEMFRPLVEERRERPGNDLISVLARVGTAGERLDDEQIFAFLRLLAPAGAETTYRSSSNLLFGLLSSPQQLDALRRDSSLIPQAIEEGLRWEPPLPSIMRRATRDTEVQGVPIPAGSSVAVNLGSANRDENYFENPDRFDIFRSAEHPHMSFAFGPHLCLGMHLARMETRVVLTTLFERLRGLRIDPQGDDVHITGMTFRSPMALPVVFEPERETTF